MKKLYIFWLKRRAKSHYLAAYYAPMDNCGRGLATYIGTKMARHRAAFNRIAEKLEQLDPNYPKGGRI